MPIEQNGPRVNTGAVLYYLRLYALTFFAILATVLAKVVI
jgi:hypothetical protein